LSTAPTTQSQSPFPPSEPRRFFPRSVWSIDFWRYAYDDARVIPLRVFAPAPPRLVFPTLARSIPVKNDDRPLQDSCCEVHVGPPRPSCYECIPGLLVCPLHLVACGESSLTSCNFCLKVLCFTHSDCPCAEASERRRQVSASVPVISLLPIHPVIPVPTAAVVPVPTMNFNDHAQPVSVPAPASPVILDSPVSDMIARCLSPGPTYDGPDPDPALMVWPLCTQPDWPISDSWRDFAFETVVLRTRSPSPVRSCDVSFSNI
jgi:hypothetical protein